MRPKWGRGKSGASEDSVLLFAYGVSWQYSNWDKGYAWCAGHGDDLPMRDLAEWLERKERPSFYSKDLGKELGPYAVWTVKLSCGHYDYHAISDIDWQPEQGYTERTDVVTKIRDRLASQNLDEKAKKQLQWSLAFQGTERFSSGGLAGLKDVDGLGELPGAPGAAAEFAQDPPGLELGVRPLAGSAEPRVGPVGFCEAGLPRPR